MFGSISKFRVGVIVRKREAIKASRKCTGSVVGHIFKIED